MSKVQETKLPYPAGQVGIVSFAPIETVEATERFDRNARLTRNGVPLFKIDSQMMIIANRQWNDVTLLTPHAIKTDAMQALVLEGEVEIIQRAESDTFIKKNGQPGANNYQDVSIFASDVRQVSMAEFSAGQAKSAGQPSQQPSTERKAS